MIPKVPQRTPRGTQFYECILISATRSGFRCEISYSPIESSFCSNWFFADCRIFQRKTLMAFPDQNQKMAAKRLRIRKYSIGGEFGIFSLTIIFFGKKRTSHRISYLKTFVSNKKWQWNASKDDRDSKDLRFVRPNEWSQMMEFLRKTQIPFLDSGESTWGDGSSYLHQTNRKKNLLACAFLTIPRIEPQEEGKRFWSEFRSL